MILDINGLWINDNGFGIYLKPYLIDIRENYELIGWKIVDGLQNKIFFSLRIQSTNNDYDPIIFSVPERN